MIEPYTQPQSALQPAPQSNVTAVNGGNPTYSPDNWNVASSLQPFNFGQQSAESAGFRQRFGDWLGGLETPQETRDKYSNKYGYEDLKEGYMRNKEAGDDLMASMRGTAGNVESRGFQTIMTQAQKDKVVQSEIAPLMEQYQSIGEIGESQGRRLAEIEGNLNDAAQLEMARQQQQMTPWLQEYQDINVKQAREFSGWTFASQLELDRLVSNRNAGLQWSNAEADRANALAQIEAKFKNDVELLEKENELDFSFWESTNV